MTVIKALLAGLIIHKYNANLIINFHNIIINNLTQQSNSPINKAAILSRDTEKDLFYHPRPHSEKHGSEARQVKQIYFTLLGHCVTKAHAITWRVATRIWNIVNNTRVYYEKKTLPTAPLFLIRPYIDKKKVIATIKLLACDDTYTTCRSKEKMGKKSPKTTVLKITIISNTEQSKM